MILECILWLLSILTNGMITMFSGIYNKWYMVLIMVLILPFVYILYVALYFFLVVIISPLIPTKKELTKPKPFSYFFVKQTFKLIMDLARIKVIMTGKENLPDGKCLYIANHRSNFDPFPLCYYFKGNIACVSKSENFSKAIFSNYIKRCCYVPMPKDDQLEQVKSINKAANLIKQDTSSILIFPEGTRNKTDDVLIPFKPGSFKIAKKAKCPLVVVSVKGTTSIKKNWPLKRTKVYVDILKVFTPEEVSTLSTVDLSNEAYNLIESNYMVK